MTEVNLSEQQKEILKQFRTNLSDLLEPHHTDAELLKWLRVKNFHVKKAERIFRQADIYRKIRCPDKTYVKPKVLQKYERTYFLGFCKDGTPVRYTSFTVDLYGFIHSLSNFDIASYFVDLMEGDNKLIMEENTKNGKEHNSVIFICDYDGYSFQDFTYKCVFEVTLEYLRVFQEYYPEKWKYIFFINVPYIFYKVSDLFKPILKNTFLERIKIASKSTTLELLREYIDDDLIPANLGGKRKNSNGEINPYAKIPEEYYLKNSMHLIDETDPNVKTVTVRARSCYNVPLVIREAGSKIRIEFRTEGGAINFVMAFREFDSDTENPDLPTSYEFFDPDDVTSGVLFCGCKMKAQSHITPNDETFAAVWPGIYILNFDNTGSWFGSRKLYYRVTVKPPNV